MYKINDLIKKGLPKNKLPKEMQQDIDTIDLLSDGFINRDEDAMQLDDALVANIRKNYTDLLPKTKVVAKKSLKKAAPKKKEEPKKKTVAKKSASKKHLKSIDGISPNEHGVFEDNAAAEKIEMPGKKEGTLGKTPMATIYLLQLEDEKWIGASSASVHNAGQSGPLSAQQKFDTKKEAIATELNSIERFAKNNKDAPNFEKILDWVEAQREAHKITTKPSSSQKKKLVDKKEPSKKKIVVVKKKQTGDEQLAECKKLLENAGKKVVEHTAGKKKIKKTVVRQDRTLIKERVTSAITPVIKDLKVIKTDTPEVKADKENTQKVITSTKELLIQIVLRIDKLAQDKNVDGIKKINELLSKLL